MNGRQPAISVGEGLAIVANMGVILGLFFVWAELRHSQTQLSAEIELSLAAAYQNAMSRAIENESVAELMRIAYADPQSLTDNQYVRLMSLHAEWMSIVYATYELWQSGAIDDDRWIFHSSYYLYFLQTRWLQDFWRGMHHEGMYPPEFLDDLEARLPTPQE